MAWELPASPTCQPNGPASTRCSALLRSSGMFETNALARPSRKDMRRPAAEGSRKKLLIMTPEFRIGSSANQSCMSFRYSLVVEYIVPTVRPIKPFTVCASTAWMPALTGKLHRKSQEPKHRGWPNTAAIAILR